MTVSTLRRSRWSRLRFGTLLVGAALAGLTGLTGGTLSDSAHGAEPAAATRGETTRKPTLRPRDLLAPATPTPATATNPPVPQPAAYVARRAAPPPAPYRLANVPTPATRPNSNSSEPSDVASMDESSSEAGTLGTSNSGGARAETNSQEPRVADRNAIQARVVDRRGGRSGNVYRGPAPTYTWIEADAPPAASAPRPLAPEDYRSDRVDRDVQVDEMTLRQKPIGLDIIDSATKSDDGESPENYAAQVLASQTPCVFGPSRYREDFVLPVDRAASEFCYRPLYFEQANLERYGTSHGALQPIISGARFFATVPTIPYQMAVYKPCVCRYWLHDYQAGRKAPCWERELPPFSAEGAGLEGLAIYGLILLVP